MTRQVIESDVCIVGSGIVGVNLARRIATQRPDLKISVVEAGQRIFNHSDRMSVRQRMLDYGENPWPGDLVESQTPTGFQSASMVVGGHATHWRANCSRMSAEDLRLKSMYGRAVDWPLGWEELERYYGVAEQMIGVAGNPSPFPEDARTTPYPMEGMPLSFNLKQIKAWAEKTGIPFDILPQARNSVPYDGRPQCLRCDTCYICPTGAKYSPDFTIRELLEAGTIELYDNVLVRRLSLREDSNEIAWVEGVHSRGEDRSYAFRSTVYVLALGRGWCPPLLLLSACERFPEGIANSSGLVGKYIVSQQRVYADIHVPRLETYPGMNYETELQTRQFFRCSPDEEYLRFMLLLSCRMREKVPRVLDDEGDVLFGDRLMERWRQDNSGTLVRAVALREVHPSHDSETVLDSSNRNRWGDALPKMTMRIDEASERGWADAKRRFHELLSRFAENDDAEILRTNLDAPILLTHEAGGCRMGTNPEESVCDSYGQTHDHDNLFVVGACTLPTTGCSNPTLTYVALGLRSADRIASRFSSPHSGTASSTR